MDHFFRRYLLILPALIVVLAAAVLVSDQRGGFWPRAALLYLDNLGQGRFASGNFSGRENNLDFTILQPGDILLGGNAGGSYGRFTHAGIYRGNGQVLESYVDNGNSIQPVSHYRDYDWAAILRVQDLTPEKVGVVLDFASHQQFKMFFPTAFKPGDRYWNCTKLIWAAFMQAGIDLDSGQDLWVTPDAIYRSPHIQVIAATGEGAL